MTEGLKRAERAQELRHRRRTTLGKLDLARRQRSNWAYHRIGISLVSDLAHGRSCDEVQKQGREERLACLKAHAFACLGGKLGLGGPR